MMEYDEEVIIKLHDTYSNANSTMNDVVQDKVTSLPNNNTSDLNTIAIQQQNNVLSDAYNKISYAEWGDEDGDFEIDEEFVQAVQSQALQDEALEHHREFMDEDCDDRTEMEEIITPEQVQPTVGKDNNEKKQEMPCDNSTKEVENVEQSLSAQVTESEKGKKKAARKTPGRKKTKADTEPSQCTNDQKYSADENSDIDSSREDVDVTPAVTKSGRKVQKPIFYNPARSDRKIKSSDISSEQQIESMKTPVKRTAERRQSKSVKSSQNKAYDVLMRIDHAMTPTPIVPKGAQRNSLENIQVFNQLLDSRDPSNLTFFNEELESDDSMVCNICQEGQSEKGNWIILCDSCDTPYHQICHKPIISDEFADSEKEWKCLNCADFPNANKRARTDKRNHTGKPRGRPRNEKSNFIVRNTPTAEISKGHPDGLVTSVNRVGPVSKLLTYRQIDILLTREQKIEYFSSLSKEVLVNLLLLAEQIAPNIPLYPANILQKYRDINVSKYGRSKLDLQAKTEMAVEESAVHMDTSESLTHHEVGENSIIPKRETPEVMTPESTVSSLSSTNVPKKDFAFYVDIFAKAIAVMNQPNGSSAHSIYSWIKSNYVVPEKFQSHAKKHLFDAVAQGIIVKNTKMTYKLNNSYPYAPLKCIGENPFKPLGQANREGLTTQNNNQTTKANLEVILDQSNQATLNNVDGAKGQGNVMNPDGQGRNLHNGQQILPIQEGNSNHDNQSTLTNCERSQCQGGQLSRQSLSQSGKPVNQLSLEQKPIDAIDQTYQESSQQILSATKPEHKDALLNNNNVVNNTSTTIQNQSINFTRQDQISRNHRNPVPVPSIVNNNIAPRPSRIRPPNSFLANQYITAPRQNTTNQGLNNFSLSNQSLSVLSGGMGSQTILPPINPQQQHQQQQQHWPTSFNPFYMIPNTSDNQFGLMHATYPTYGQSQQTANYRGHNGMQSNSSLMNGNHNGQNINGSVNSSLQEMG